MCATTNARPVTGAPRGRARGQTVSNEALKSQVQVDDGYLLALAKQGNPDAYDRLVRRYYAFVRLKASSYFLLGGDSEDLIQEGLVGLYKAIRDFRPDRESSFRNFAELCITRQIITAVKTATRNKHTPLNGYVSFSATPAGAERRASRRSTRCCPARPVHDPVNQVISSEELRSLVACLSTVLSELESRVLALYLDGHSYTAIGEQLELRLQDGRQRPAARQAQGRRAPGLARRPAVSLSRADLADHRPWSSSRSWRSAGHRALDAAAAHRGGLPGRARAGQPRPRRRAAADRGWDRGRSRAPRAASTRSSAARSPSELLLVEVLDRPGTDEDKAIFRVRAARGEHRAHPRSPRRRVGARAASGSYAARRGRRCSTSSTISITRSRSSQTAIASTSACADVAVGEHRARAASRRRPLQ